MRVIEDVRKSQEAFRHVVVTAGSFDGVHLGHQRVLQETVRQAKSLGGTAAAITMRPHPREFFSAERPPNLLTSHTKKLELLQGLGLDVVFVLPFDNETASLEREAFVREIICGRCQAEWVIVGHDFCFGRDASGDHAYLAEQGALLGFGVRQVPPLIVNGERVSSTLIREYLLEGELDQVEAFLGRKYSVSGEVLHGRGVGMSLGFPTANIKPHHSAIPPQGVYAAHVLADGQCYGAAVNIGVAPTIRNEDLTIEAFLLEFSGDLRGREIEVVFQKRIRSEKRFPSREALIAGIHDDVQQVKTILSGGKPSIPVL